MGTPPLKGGVLDVIFSNIEDIFMRQKILAAFLSSVLTLGLFISVFAQVRLRIITR